MDGLLGVAGMIITSDDWDHSPKFPAFSTSKFMNGWCKKIVAQSLMFSSPISMKDASMAL